MAIKEIKREWSPCQLDYVKTFLLHSEADVKDLPKCCIGSKATVSETDNEYFCTADGWKLGSELGGGQTVILEETEMITVDVTPGISGAYLLDKPLAAPLVDGATYEIVWGGEKYTSKTADATALGGVGVTTYLLGRSPNEENMPSPGPDCPFMLLIFPDGVEDAGVMLYGQIDSTVIPDLPTISIVEKAGTESAGGGGGFVVKATIVGMDSTGTNAELAVDKTFVETMEAIQAGRYVVCQLDTDGTINLLPAISYEPDAAIVFMIYSGVATVMVIMQADGSASMQIQAPEQ